MCCASRDKDGFEGWGEAVRSGSRSSTDEALSGLVDIPVTELRLSFLDLWPEGALYWQRPPPPSPYAADPANLQHRLRHPLQALVEMALSDLTARRAGLPLCALWGGAWRDRVPVDYWMPRTTPDQAGPWLRESHLLTRDLEVENGLVLIPAGPGMGVEVDLDAVDRYCTRHRAWPPG